MMFLYFAITMIIFVKQICLTDLNIRCNKHALGIIITQLVMSYSNLNGIT